MVFYIDAKIKEIVDATKVKFGLNNYYLQTYRLCRSIDSFRNTKYSLSMEWFSNHITELEDEDLNPKGTVVIEIDINQNKLESIIFVGDKNFASKNMFESKCTRNLIKWIEQETGLTYKKQFQLVEEKEGRLLFKECYKGIAVSSSGFIDLRLNKEGHLTLFTVYGDFPSKERFKEEDYTLTFENIEDLIKEQYVLCGKLDSLYTVNAVNGGVIVLNDL